MPNLKGIKPGEELVRVPKDWRRGRRGSLTPKTVRVHKVGHTLVHVLRYEDDPSGRTDAFRIDTGISNDGYSSSELWRLEDWAVEQRREEVEAALRKHGVEVWRKRQPVPVLEAILAVLEGESRPGWNWPKWPRLMVRGKNIRPEQADLVILRTTSFTGGVSGGGRKVNSMVRRAFGVQSSLYDDSWYSEWDRAAAEVGALDVHYVHSDRIVSFSAGGPEGWVSWGGQVFCRNMHLLSKWPSVGEVTDDWRQIAHAFPFLELRAQLVAEEWNREYERVESYRPLAAWDVGGGAAELKADPGEPLFRPSGLTRAEEIARTYANGFPPEQGVSERRLRAAVRRCRRKAGTETQRR